MCNLIHRMQTQILSSQLSGCWLILTFTAKSSEHQTGSARLLCLWDLLVLSWEPNYEHPARAALAWCRRFMFTFSQSPVCSYLSTEGGLCHSACGPPRPQLQFVIESNCCVYTATEWNTSGVYDLSTCKSNLGKGTLSLKTLAWGEEVTCWPW